MMKIAFVQQPGTEARPPKGCSSIQILTYHLARNIAKSHEAIVYGKQHPEFPSEIRESGVLYRGFPADRIDKFTQYLKALDRFSLTNPEKPVFSWSIFNAGNARRFAQAIASDGCDVIWVHNYSQFVPILKKFNPKAKIILQMHCEWLNELDARMIDARLRQTDLILGVSNYITSKIVEKYPQHADRCHTIFNGVDLKQFSATAKVEKPQGKNLLYVGRVSPEKGVHVLLKAFETVIQRFPEVTLDIVGPNFVPSKAYLLRLSQDRKVMGMDALYSSNYKNYLEKEMSPAVRKAVKFVGNVSPKKIHEHYHKADLFVFPSVWKEPFGMPIVEAMAAGLPVVTTTGGAFPEIVEDGKTGLLVEPGDADALAGALCTLLADPERQAAMGCNGRDRVTQQFQWEQIVAQVLDLCVGQRKDEIPHLANKTTGARTTPVDLLSPTSVHPLRDIHQEALGNFQVRGAERNPKSVHVPNQPLEATMQHGDRENAQ